MGDYPNQIAIGYQIQCGKIINPIKKLCLSKITFKFHQKI